MTFLYSRYGYSLYKKDNIWIVSDKPDIIYLTDLAFIHYGEITFDKYYKLYYYASYGKSREEGFHSLNGAFLGCCLYLSGQEAFGWQNMEI